MCLTAIWLYVIDLDSVVQILSNAKIIVVLPLICLFFAMYFIRSLRWKIILSPIERITAFQSFNLCMINYFINFLIPVHAGEVAKSFLLKEMKGTPVSKSLPTVYLDKIADLFPIFLILIIAPFLNNKISTVVYLASGIFFVLLILASLFLTFFISRYRKDSTQNAYLVSFLPKGLRTKFFNSLSLFADGLLSLKALSNKLFDIITLTFLAFVIHCLFMWLFFYSFNIELPLLTVIVGYSLLNMSFILPAPPGFSGSLELTFILIFTFLYGYDKNLVSAVAASSHILIAVLFAIFGLSCMALIGTQSSTLFKVDSKDIVLP